MYELVALAVRCGGGGFLGAWIRRCGRADWQVERRRIGVHRADTCSCLACGATHLLCPARQHNNVTYLMTVHLLHCSCGVVGEKIYMNCLERQGGRLPRCAFSSRYSNWDTGVCSPFFYTVCIFSGPPLWSSGQSFWLQIQRPRVRFPALPDFSE